MKTVNLSEASAPLAAYARDLGDETIVLLADGKPVAALLPLRDVDHESLALSSNQAFLDVIHRSRCEMERGENESLEALEKDFA